MKTKNGFLSVSVLLFLSLFLFLVVSNKEENYANLLTIKITDTKKQNQILNFEEYIIWELERGGKDPFVLKESLSKNLSNYLNEEGNWFIINIKTNKRKKITKTEMDKITKVIILKPAPNTLLKRYTITNGLNKNEYLSFEIRTNCSKTIFSFPKNYAIEVLVHE